MEKLDHTTKGNRQYSFRSRARKKYGMSEADFYKKRWKACETIEYYAPHIRNVDGEMGQWIVCLLIQVDFDNCNFRLAIMPDEYGDYYEDAFWAHCNNCRRPSPKPKLVK